MSKQDYQQEEEQKLDVDLDIDACDEEEFEISNYEGGNKDDEEFDNIVGCLQDIVISQEFEILQKQFFQKNYQIFEEEEENKIEYMIIFKEYQKTIESEIEKQLKLNIKGFEMKRFLEILEKRTDQIDEQLLDMLYSFSEFEIFKQYMLDYKKQFAEEERIQKLKTIKSTRKTNDSKSNKANPISNKPPNIFADSNQIQKDIFGTNKDPLQELKNLKMSSNDNKNKKQQQQQGSNPQIQSNAKSNAQEGDVDPEDIKEEDLRPSFYFDIKQIKTPQIKKKDNQQQIYQTTNVII